MSNFVRSFSEGFDVGNKVINTMDRRERLAAYDERQKTIQNREDTQWEQQQEAYQHGLDRREITEQQADQAHELGLKQTQQSMTLALAGEERAKKNEKRLIEKDKRDQEVYSYEKKIQTRQQDAVVFEDQLRRAQATKDYSWFNGEDAQAIFERNPQFNPQWITSDEVYQSSGRLINTLKGTANGQLPQWNDQDLLEDINNVFPEIANSTDLPQYTKEGKKIVGRKVTGIIPMEGGKVAIQLDVIDEDGKTYSAPLTQKRSNDDDDNVAVMGIDELSKRLNLINQGRQDEIFLTTSKYMGTDKNSSKNKHSLQKEIFAAENKISEDYRAQIAELDANPSYMDNPEAKRARKIELEKERDSELAQVRLRASNVLNGGFINLEGAQREKSITNTLEQFKQAFADLEFTPEIDGAIREAIENGEDAEFISSMLANEQRKQARTSNPDQSQEEKSSSILSDIVGTPKTTSTGGQTTEGGRFYNAGNDIGKPNVVNEAQANMTPYQARPSNSLASYNPYK